MRSVLDSRICRYELSKTTKESVMKSGLQAEIWTRNLWNTNQECLTTVTGHSVLSAVATVGEFGRVTWEVAAACQVTISAFVWEDCGKPLTALRHYSRCHSTEPNRVAAHWYENVGTTCRESVQIRDSCCHGDSLPLPAEVFSMALFGLSRIPTVRLFNWLSEWKPDNTSTRAMSCDEQ